MASPGASCPIRRSSWTSAWLAWIARRPTTAALAERLERGRTRPRERTQALEQGVQVARGGAQVAQDRLLRLGQVAQLRGVGLQLGEEGRQVLEALAQRNALAGGGLGGPPCLAHEAADVGLAPLELADDPVGVADQRLDRLRLAPEDAQRLARLAQARVRRVGSRR